MDKKEFSVSDIFNSKSNEELDINKIIESNKYTPQETEIKVETFNEPIIESSPVITKEDFTHKNKKQEEIKNFIKEKFNQLKTYLAKKCATQKKVKMPKVPPSKKQVIFKTTMIIATVLVFALFGAFLLKQYSYVYLSHDDYGYATLSYVYWEEGIWGQNFTTEQLVHYLTQHYNRWGGRVLSFGQSILLMQAGLDVTRGFHALTLCATFLLAFLFAQNGKKTKLLPVSALFCVSLFGIIGKEVALSGFYWYIAAIIYTVPVLYIFIGLWLMYIMLLDDRKGAILTISKLLMIPFATIIMFFAGFSMEQTGIFAVVSAAALLCYASFKRKNPLVLIYGVPPFVSSLIGCHIMLMAKGNLSRKNGSQSYYELPFSKQILQSGENIVKTLFSEQNLLMVILISVITFACAFLLIKKYKTRLSKIWAIIALALSVFALACASCSYNTGIIAALLWISLIAFAITVSWWLFSNKTKQDTFIWVLFLGGLASQGACLISPIYHDRCLVMFYFALFVVAIRLFNSLLAFSEEKHNKKALLQTVCVTLTVVIMGSVGASQIFNGFKENNRVQDYNHRLLTVTGIMYDEYGVVTETLPLMKLKDEKYTGSTMPYDRDLIKDWMKIYYRLPKDLTYADFDYNKYDEELLNAYEQELIKLEETYLKTQK